MDKLKLFVDFDNTITNSTKKMVEMLNLKYKTDKNWKYLKKYNFSDLFPQTNSLELDELFSSKQFFEELEILENCSETLNEMKNHYDISIVTLGTYDNIINKITFMQQQFKTATIPVYGHECNNNNKHFMDMSNGVMIDDNIECLRNCNAKIKILIKNGLDTNFNRVEPTDNVYIVNNWFEINQILSFYVKEGKII